MSMLFGSAPKPPPPPPVPPVLPDPPIKPKDTKAGDREVKRVQRKRGQLAANVTGGLTTVAPTTKKTLLGQ
jgi:hypothetical protein